MRQRLVNEKAAAKTLSFLKELSDWCKHIDVFNMSDLIKKHGVSKSTGTTCLKLDLIEKTKDAYRWIAAEPERSTALRVLEVLRLRNDKMVAIPLEGFESLVDTLQQLVISLKPKTENRMTVGNYEKQIADKKHDDFVKIVTSIAGGVWNEMIKKTIDEAELNRTNDFIITASKDLLTKIYK